MKIIKLFLVLTFGLWADFISDVSSDINVSKYNRISFLDKVRIEFDYRTFSVDENVDDIKNIPKQQEVLDKLQGLFPLYLESDNPFSILNKDRYLIDPKMYPSSEITNFLRLTTLYMNESKMDDVSSQLLEKTLVSINKTIQQGVSLLPLSMLVFESQAFLGKMDCYNVEMEKVLLDNSLVAISWDKVLNEEAQSKLKLLTDSMREEAKRQNNADIEKYIDSLERILLSKFEVYNKNILMAMKKNVNSIEKYMMPLMQSDEKKMEKLRLKVQNNMKAYSNKEEFLKVKQNLNDLMVLKATEVVLFQMSTLGLLDRIILSIKNVHNIQSELVESCTR